MRHEDYGEEVVPTYFDNKASGREDDGFMLDFGEIIKRSDSLADRSTHMLTSAALSTSACALAAKVIPHESLHHVVVPAGYARLLHVMEICLPDAHPND